MRYRQVTVVGSRRSASPSTDQRSAGLLMSATLAPPAGAVSRDDPTVRLDDYLDTLRFYLTLPGKTIDRILFVDNSDSDLAALEALARETPHDKVVELISFAGNDHAVARGKAYGEFRLMDFGLQHATVFEPEDIVWKTTGRLKFLNLPQMASSVRRPYDLLCDLHNVPLIGTGRWRGNRYMDLRVFSFRRGAYDSVFRGSWQENPDNYDASYLYDRVLGARRSLRVIPRFPRQPWIQGISGRHQRGYLSLKQRWKDWLRGALRWFAPWIWM